MCLLSYYPPGVQPQVLALRTGVSLNSDGAGFALFSPTGQIITLRSLDSQSVVEEFLRTREKYPDGPAVFHARWLTSGERTPENCQPLDVAGIGVIAHNGVIPGLRPAGSSRSDSQILAEEIVPRFADHLEDLEEWMGRENKAVIITLDGRGILLGERFGRWRGDEWHSNSDFLPPSPVPVQPKVTLKKLSRELGDRQLAADAKAGAARAALFALIPDLRYGEEIL